MKLEGVYSVLPTPFTAGGELDLESLKRVVDLCAKYGRRAASVTEARKILKLPQSPAISTSTRSAAA